MGTSLFRIGEKYTHEEVYRGLGVGNAGGIRPCIGKEGELRRLVVMTSVPTARIASENPYHDRVEGNVLVYTAAGREGNQFVSGLPWDSSYHDGPAPWDIGQPQPAIVRLASEGGFAGAVLDAGCGTGENALHVASLGLPVLGVDVAETALAI